MTTFQILTTDEIEQIAARYGFDPADPVVIENAIEAESHHGKRREQVSWATDRHGVTCAANLLDGYLDQITAEARIDALAHADFRAQAYGE